VVEGLEGRELLTASLAAIGPVNVPSSLGYQVPLNGSGTTDAQTFTVTSSNPDIKATVATGKFLTFNVSHTPASGQPTDPTITNQPFTMQLFSDLTPKTVAHFETFVNDGFYPNLSKGITRIVSNFSGTSSGDFVIQGGEPTTPNSTGGSGQPGTPYGLEQVQQLGFVSPGAIGVARTSDVNSNDTQFFIATGTPYTLNGPNGGPGYTVFAQLLSDPTTQNTVSQLEKVAVQPNSSGENSSPISPVTFNSATLSDTNPNGVLHIDATGAYVGQTATITVTAHDSVDHTTTSQTFQVTAVADFTYPTNHSPAILYKPLASPVTQSVSTSTGSTVQLNGNSQNPNNSAIKLQYALASQPSHGTVSNFNASTGTLTYTPNSGFTGVDTFRYTVSNLGGSTSPLAGNTAPVTLTVTQTQPPTATAVTQQATQGTATTVTLAGNTNNPSNPDVTLQFALTSQPAHGTISNFNATAGTLTYTPNAGFLGTDSFTFSVSNVGGNPSPLQGTSATATLDVVSPPVTPVATGAVRVIGTTLVVTPLPRTDKGTNTISIEENVVSGSPANDRLVVLVNGQVDSTEPLVQSINQIVVYGSKANDNINISPTVDSTLPVTLDGGHGGKNFLRGGDAGTREHGWFGTTTLIGGTGPNALVGRKGNVHFLPTTSTFEIYAANRPVSRRANPGGTFYRSVNGVLVPETGSRSTTSSSGGTTKTTSTTTGKTAAKAKPSTVHPAKTAKKSY
jgi:cyclophilin family peptidyl-prolyl cis-trans isomerase